MEYNHDHEKMFHSIGVSDEDAENFKKEVLSIILESKKKSNMVESLEKVIDKDYKLKRLILLEFVSYLLKEAQQRLFSAENMTQMLKEVLNSNKASYDAVGEESKN
jgi:uncharacterized protein with ParB-like and HNH nuclease domain